MRLPYVVAALSAVATLGGLLFPTVYRDDALIREGFLANDMITLLVAMPILIASRGSPLVRLGALHYFVYDYCFYLFGAVLNPLLLVYAAIVATAAWSIAISARELDLSAYEKGPSAPRRRGVAAWLVFVSLGLATTWIAQWLVALLRKPTPARFDVTPEFIRVTAALDLTLVVGLMVPAAILIWRGRPWGIVLGAMTSVSGAMYNVVLAAGTFAQLKAGVPGAGFMMVLWIGLFVGCTTAAAVLLRSVSGRVEGAAADELAKEGRWRNVLGVDRHEPIDEEPQPVRR